MVEIANILIRQGRPERAVELLAFKEVMSDPQYEQDETLPGYPTSERLRQELVELLPPDQFAAAWTRGQMAELRSVVNQLLDDQN